MITAAEYNRKYISRTNSCNRKYIFSILQNEQSPKLWLEGRKSWTWVSLWLAFNSKSFLFAVQGHGPGDSHTWTHMAMPIPPPMQRLATPRVAPRRRIAWTRVTSTRQPLAPDDNQHISGEDGGPERGARCYSPMGWPRAIEPPLTFTLAGSTPSSFTCDVDNI